MIQDKHLISMLYMIFLKNDFITFIDNLFLLLCKNKNYFYIKIYVKLQNYINDSTWNISIHIYIFCISVNNKKPLNVAVRCS